MSAGPYEPVASLGALLGNVLKDLKDLVQSEIRLARVEFDEKIHKVIIGVVFIVGGAFVSFAGLVVLFQGIAALLAFVLPVWAALLIVGAVIVIGAALLVRVGVTMLSLKTLAPARTWSNFEKDARLIKEHV